MCPSVRNAQGRVDEIGQHLVVPGVVARLTYDVIVGLLCARSSLHPQPKHIQSLYGIFHGIKQANQRHTKKNSNQNFCVVVQEVKMTPRMEMGRIRRRKEEEEE